MDILVLHPGALGDIILSLPALEILRRRFSQARITLAANLDFAGVVAADYVDSLLSFSGLPLHNLFGSGPVPAVDRRFWSAFDRIVSWTGFGDPQFARNLNSFHKFVLVVPWKPQAGETRHVARIFVDSIRPWVGEQREIPTPSLSINPADLASGEQWLTGRGWKADRPMVALHPGAGSIAKRWPLENFRELAGRFVQSGLQLLIIEGPAEDGLSERMADGIPGGLMMAARGLPLRTLAGLLRFCTTFVGNDSGISHLAAVLNVPTLVLFGPSRPEQWAPSGARVKTLAAAHGCIACVSVDSVWNALDHCRHC